MVNFEQRLIGISAANDIDEIDRPFALFREYLEFVYLLC